VASTTHGRRDFVGSSLGMLVFLGGIALLLVTFRLAYQLFSVPPSNAIGAQPKQVLDPTLVGNNLTVLVLRVLLLLIMGIVGSLVANKGILLYTHSRAATIHVEPKE
jgi:hypothetical protein